MNDEQAMWRVQMQSDNAAFVELLQRWEQPIVRLCARMTGDPHRAEDLKQETFVRVFARRKQFRPDGKFSTWLWRIALNLCYDELRRRQRHGECPLGIEPVDASSDAPELASEEPSPDFSLAAQEETELVRQALLRLPENQRAVVVLRYCEGLKLREIADVLEVPETTASSRIAVGLAQLTRMLEPELGGEGKGEHRIVNVQRPTSNHGASERGSNGRDAKTAEKENFNRKERGDEGSNRTIGGINGK